MADSSQQPISESQTDQYPLLYERHDKNGNREHIIHIERGGEASSSHSPNLDNSSGLSPDCADRPTSINVAPVSRSSSSSQSQANSRSFRFRRRNERFGRRHSGVWISIELLFTLGQIIASTVVLYLSRHGHPQALLFAWIIGYTAGCFLSLPILCWRYLVYSRVTEQETSQLNQDSPERNSSSDSSSYTTTLFSQPSELEDQSGATYNGQALRVANPRVSLLVDHLKMALDCFFAIWFVVGNIWIFSGRSSASEAPNLYKLCIVYLTLNCIGYAMPFILCAVVCCCLPCIISVLGLHEDWNRVRGANDESINALPTYKFNLMKKESGGTLETDADEECGIVGAGTEKERTVSREDAVCCICLERYADEDELKELPCSHFFHSDCVDRWLKINASCPLCKFEIDERNEDSPSHINSLQQT
ncbi:hypothetical protein Nepgr_020777 [Nepenthes gracilis]|uniref:RING-type domain-containing protein n=1 Tax=Nepenthes gracilis TaxID=150966 RepID=A0AAD3SZI4_NEPGR|nr:hypothetical protein Nepgr_020777 [Nepenthes gracilis]